MAWGRTHNTIYPIGNNKMLTTSESFNKSGNALPPIDCCKALELQIADIYRKLCAIKDAPITVIDTLSVNLTATGVLNHTLSADVILDPDITNKLVIRTDGLYGAPADFSITFNTTTRNLTLEIDGNTSIVNIPGGAGSTEVDTVYYGSDFSNDTDLVDSALNGKTFRVFWRGLSSFMIPTVEWDYITGGGFSVLLSGFIVDPSDIFFVQFY